MYFLQAFYERLGYNVCHKISAVGAVGKLLGEGALEGLLKHIARKHAASVAAHDGNSNSGADAGSGAEETAGADAIWLRKALCETLGHVPTVRDDECEALLADIDKQEMKLEMFDQRGIKTSGKLRAKGDQANTVSTQSRWKGVIVDMTWERQVSWVGLVAT